MYKNKRITFILIVLIWPSLDGNLDHEHTKATQFPTLKKI